MKSEKTMNSCAGENKSPSKILDGGWGVHVATLRQMLQQLRFML